ncbi:TetR/AcrR family transcriptional regulator [Halopseudomonas pachastrellae]|nr:TetR/AcrR family transcriptional regulator [Halopseudomonas pachastrellae]
MDDIAKGAQLSRALLYVYFKDKAAIMRGVMLRAGYALLNEFRAARDAGGSGLQQLERMGQSYYRFSLEQPDYFDVLTNASTFAHLMESDEQTEDMETCSALTMGCMVDSLEAGVTDGSPAASASATLWSPPTICVARCTASFCKHASKASASPVARPGRAVRVHHHDVQPIAAC